MRQIRHALGWSQVDLARAMHVRFETIGRWEQHRQELSNLAIRTLQRVLMVPWVAASLSEELKRLATDATDTHPPSS